MLEVLSVRIDSLLRMKAAHHGRFFFVVNYCGVDICSPFWLETGGVQDGAGERKEKKYLVGLL